MSRSIPFLELAPMHADLADELKSKFAKLLEKGLFSGGEEVDTLEKTMREYLNVPHAIPCANGTDALELALRALEIGPGDEVIVPALTWVSTAEVVSMVGAKVVFCDVDGHGLMDLLQLPGLMTARTRAIIPVHLYGKMVDMERLLKLTVNTGIHVIEDAAQAFGAFQKGRSAGAFGAIGCFSFYPTKNLGALGETGLLSTHDPSLAERLRLLSNHGQPRRDTHEVIGRNSRIDTLQAAFLNVKFSYFTVWQQKRKALAKVYLDHLQHLKRMTVPSGILQEEHNAHLFTVQTEQRDALKAYFAERGIGTAVHYPLPVPSTEAFEVNKKFPVASRLSNLTLSLPLHPYLHEDDVRRVCEEVQRFFSIR
ncbi:DegT/DnrJ/EryC1/StrS family aminotransferase [Echinicola strongylocentroti]|uniref:DegT/DnrJ/EryC1/StrS family aminotransferase n=1 Tax=Echinicola strongylocentroti TaxID=1795355 RepID=A0A2Z4IE65_9BACT|nr:DegT/DnrJ/EryC1/StrS family aminotransferase [Echinicola strongylocentroti]AWW29130.1 DegT/DnrJ/EryC1/StrS family aminotransferase [Echinicola strongylocentroti]